MNHDLYRKPCPTIEGIISEVLWSIRKISSQLTELESQNGLRKTDKAENKFKSIVFALEELNKKIEESKQIKEIHADSEKRSLETIEKEWNLSKEQVSTITQEMSHYLGSQYSNGKRVNNSIIKEGYCNKLIFDKEFRESVNNILAKQIEALNKELVDITKFRTEKEQASDKITEQIKQLESEIQNVDKKTLLNLEDIKKADLMIEENRKKIVKLKEDQERLNVNYWVDKMISAKSDISETEKKIASNNENALNYPKYVDSEKKELEGLKERLKNATDDQKSYLNFQITKLERKIARYDSTIKIYDLSPAEDKEALDFYLNLSKKEVSLIEDYDLVEQFIDRFNRCWLKDFDEKIVIGLLRTHRSIFANVMASLDHIFSYLFNYGEKNPNYLYDGRNEHIKPFLAQIKRMGIYLYH